MCASGKDESKTPGKGETRIQSEASLPERTGPRILIVRVGAMGDVLHALPAVAMLRQRLPNAYIGWAIEPRWASLLQSESITSSTPAGSPSMPLVDHVHPVETRAWSKHPISRGTASSILALRRDLRQHRYALAIDLQGSIRSAGIARLSGAQIVGSTGPRERPARLFYSHRIATTAPHVIQQAAEIVKGALRLLPPDTPALLAAPEIVTEIASEIASFQRSSLLPQDEAAEFWCNTLLGSDTAPVVLLAPAAGWGAKQWPAERYGTLAAELAARGCRVLVNATPPLPDTTAGRVLHAAESHIANNSPRAVIKVVSSTLTQLISLLRHTDLVIAGDTGPLHLAAALGRPVVALFGPTDPARNGPFGTHARVLRDPASVTDHHRYAETEAGLQRITVEAVLSASLDLLALNADTKPGR